MKTIRQRIADKRGSSIISVLVAFVLLLLGIGAFGAAIGTANEMVRRAEVLNVATGQVLEKFYQDYAMTPVDNRDFVTAVNQVTVDGEGNVSTVASAPFRIHTKLRKKQYDLTIEKDDGGGSGSGGTTLTYEMFYYK